MKTVQSRTWLLTGLGALALAASASIATAQRTDSTTTRRATRVARARTHIRVTKEASYGGSSSTSSSAASSTNGLAPRSTRTDSAGRRSYTSSGSIDTTSLTTAPATSNAAVTSPATTPATSNPAATSTPGTTATTGNALTGTTPRDSMAMGSPATMPSMSMSSAPSANDVAVLDAMTDPNILAHLAASDSAEIAMSQPLVTTAQNPAVRDFAQTLVTDHTRALQMVRAAAQQANVTPQPSAGDSAQGRMMMTMQTRLEGAPVGTQRDQLFVSMQVMHHQHVLSELQTLRNIATSSAVRQQIDSEIAVVQSHLATAQQLAQTLGVSGTMNMNGMGGMGGTTPPSTAAPTTSPSTPPSTSTPPSSTTSGSATPSTRPPR